MASQAKPPENGSFQFWGCSEIRESLGLRADSEPHLLERLETAPLESIYYHTVRCLLRRRVFPTPYPDDFSTWVANEARDLTLAERLAFHSPFDFTDGEAFRQHLLETLDDHLSRLPVAPAAVRGKPFYFLTGHLVAVPLEIEASDLRSLGAALVHVDDSALYYHAVEAIGRLGNPRGDFAAWVEDVLRLPSLARRIAEIDPFVMSLAGVRGRLLELVDSELALGPSA
jgi:hypothetical protein